MSERYLAFVTTRPVTGWMGRKQAIRNPFKRGGVWAVSTRKRKIKELQEQPNDLIHGLK